MTIRLTLAIAAGLCWCIGGVSPTPIEANQRESTSTLKILPPESLAREPSLLPAVKTGKARVSDWIGELSQVTGKAILVFGDLSPDVATLEKINGKPAHAGMSYLAARVVGKWERYEDFYVLSPTEWERHAARPLPRDGRYKELRRAIQKVHSGSMLLETLQKVGKENRVLLMVVGTTATVPARRRMLLPCTIAAQGRTLDALMRAMTAALGDPWERLGTAHALSFTGEPTTLAERQRMAGALAAANFAQSISPVQEEQMRSTEGLSAAALSPAQQAQLAAGTARMRAPHNIGVGQLRLTRIPAGEDRWDTSIRISILNPGGTLIRIGGITAP